MTDTRPAPEYGEYATPEEQAAAMGIVRVPVEELPPPVVPTAPVPERPQGRRWDLVLTIALLIFGSYITISGLATYSDMAGSLTQVYSLYGYDGEYPDTDQASIFGTIINVVQVVALVLVMWFSSRSLRAGRVTFWIPLTAGVVTSAISTLLIMTLLFADPDFVQFMTTSIGA